MIPRRAFIGSLGLGVLAMHRHAYAQPSAKIPQVGYFGRSAPNPFVDAFRMALHDLGYVEDETIVITTRWTEGKLERLPALAAELVRLKMDVIVASATPAALAAKQATGVIPIVMIGGDPILSGLVDSLARPGRNITGLTLVLPELDGKRLELLKEVVPAFSRVATLLPTGNRAAFLRLQESRRAAQKLGVSLQVVEVTSSFDFESAFDL